MNYESMITTHIALVSNYITVMLIGKTQNLPVVKELDLFLKIHKCMGYAVLSCVPLHYLKNVPFSKYTR